ncbi:hypothetical protein Tco_0218797 [Tanacetum coccineum]
MCEGGDDSSKAWDDAVHGNKIDSHSVRKFPYGVDLKGKCRVGLGILVGEDTRLAIDDLVFASSHSERLGEGFFASCLRLVGGVSRISRALGICFSDWDEWFLFYSSSGLG